MNKFSQKELMAEYKEYYTKHPNLLNYAIQHGHIGLSEALEILTNKTNKMKNLITIEGKEFELPDELVNKIKEELNKPKKMTYKDICNDLDHKFFREYLNGEICYSLNQLNKLEAINKLMNTAKYLNGNWKGDWNFIPTDNWKFCFKLRGKGLLIEAHVGQIEAITYFATREAAQEAINILGEETIKLALSTDW
jgi:hypothetical protein